jgi:hypothetical protein
MHGLALALFYSAVLGYFELNPSVVEHLASDLIELSTRHNFAHLLATGAVCRGWARSASGNTGAGIAGIEEGIEGWVATGAIAAGTLARACASGSPVRCVRLARQFIVMIRSHSALRHCCRSLQPDILPWLPCKVPPPPGWSVA